MKNTAKRQLFKWRRRLLKGSHLHGEEEAKRQQEDVQMVRMVHWMHGHYNLNNYSNGLGFTFNIVCISIKWNKARSFHPIRSFALVQVMVTFLTN